MPELAFEAESTSEAERLVGHENPIALLRAVTTIDDLVVVACVENRIPYPEVSAVVGLQPLAIYPLVDDAVPTSRHLYCVAAVEVDTASELNSILSIEIVVVPAASRPFAMYPFVEDATPTWDFLATDSAPPSVESVSSANVKASIAAEAVLFSVESPPPAK